MTTFLVLGRSTIQWLALIAVLLQVAKQFVPVTFTNAALAIDALTAADAALMAWVAQTSTTPVTSPRLTAGTTVDVLDAAGKVLGQTTATVAAGPSVTGTAKL